MSQVAAALGVTPGHLAALERGHAALTLARARRLAMILDVPIETLIMGRPRQAPKGARRGRRRRSLQIGDLVEIVAGPFSGVSGIVDKPADEAPHEGLIGITCQDFGSGLYAPAAVRRVGRRAAGP